MPGGAPEVGAGEEGVLGALAYGGGAGLTR